MTGSVAGILYAYAVRFLGPAYQAVDASYAKVSPTMTQSALCLGASPRQVLTRVHLPLVRPGVAVALVLVAIDAVKELPIVLLLRPFGFTTVSVWVYQLAAENFWSLAALPALLIVLLALVPVVLLFRQVRAADDQVRAADDHGALTTDRRAVALRASARPTAAPSPPTASTSRCSPGELVTLIGPSGCGKSTVLRLLAGLERPDSGSVMLAGTEVAGPRRFVAPERRRVGLVFQDHALFPHLTVARNVGFGLDRLGRAERAARVAEVLALVRLGDLAARYPHELSGGEQQRVALARALAPGPTVVLLDEPFSSLDETLRAQVRAELVGVLRETRTTAVLVTHDQTEALSIGDRVVVMRDGRVEQEDTPQARVRAAGDEVRRVLHGRRRLPARPRPRRAADQRDRDRLDAARMGWRRHRRGGGPASPRGGATCPRLCRSRTARARAS